MCTNLNYINYSPDIIKNNPKNWDEIWSLYESSFPEHERRSKTAHLAAMHDPQFITQGIYLNDNKSFVGLLFYWSHMSNQYKINYIEHIAINPSLRGQGYGSLCMAYIVDTLKSAILEIDPPTDAVSIKRLQFYQHAKLIQTPYVYTHPSYKTNGKVHQLNILAYPDIPSPSQYADYTKFISDCVLKYID